MPQVVLQFYKIETWQQYLAKQSDLAQTLAQLTIYLQSDNYDHYFYHTLWYEKLALSLCDRSYLTTCEKNNYRNLIKEALGLTARSFCQKPGNERFGRLIKLHPAFDSSERSLDEKKEAQEILLQTLENAHLLPENRTIAAWLEAVMHADDKLWLFLAAGCVSQSFWARLLQETLAFNFLCPNAVRPWFDQKQAVNSLLSKYCLSDRPLESQTVAAEISGRPITADTASNPPAAQTAAIADSPEAAEETKALTPPEASSADDLWQTRVISLGKGNAKPERWQATEELSPDEANEKGIRLFKGEGVAQDQALAVQMFAQAARGGSLEGQYNLAFCCAGGFGLAQDSALALKWYTQAAQGGYLPAMCKLGEIYEKGQGTIAPDGKLALQWYERAALEGHADSQFKTAQYYANGEVTAQNYEQAAKFYLLAAQNNHPQAQYNYGICCYLALGRPKDLAESFKWYQKAAENGLPGAQNELANCYYYGSGTAKNLEEALKWYKTAAQAGYAPAQCNLATRYFLGEGVKENNAEAFKWFQLSAAQNYAEAQNYLGLCYDNGYGTKKDQKTAFSYYALAHEQKHKDATNNLALCYYYGTGVKKDKDKAKELFLEARDLGSQDAKENLRKFYKIQQ